MNSSQAWDFSIGTDLIYWVSDSEWKFCVLKYPIEVFFFPSNFLRIPRLKSIDTPKDWMIFFVETLQCRGDDGLPTSLRFEITSEINRSTAPSSMRSTIIDADQAGSANRRVLGKYSIWVQLILHRIPVTLCKKRTIDSLTLDLIIFDLLVNDFRISLSSERSLSYVHLHLSCWPSTIVDQWWSCTFYWFHIQNFIKYQLLIHSDYLIQSKKNDCFHYWWHE